MEPILPQPLHLLPEQRSAAFVAETPASSARDEERTYGFSNEKSIPYTISITNRRHLKLNQLLKEAFCEVL